jgi:tetratricopeptide (TPR) repeat protein
MGTSARIDELRKKFDENPRRYFAPLANEYRKAGDLEQAIFICQEYLPQQPGHMSGHIVYGQALYESGREDEAKAVFETALSLDPENLIALKHLGDIARASGDTSTARGWYQRVLDADPRNDEITALLSSLGTESAAPAMPRERFTPLSNAVIETTPEAEPSHDEPLTYAANASEIEKSQEAFLPGEIEYGAHVEQGESASEISDNVPPIPPSHPAPAAAASDDDLLDLDDFSLGGVPTGATTPDEPVAQASTGGLDGDVTISGGFTFGADDATFDTESFADGAPAPSPDIELATDIDLGLTQEGSSQESDAESAPDRELSSLPGLETFEAGVIASAPIDAPVLATDAFFDLPPVDEHVSPSPTEEPMESSSAESAFENAFVSEDSAPIDGGHDGLDVPEAATAVASFDAVIDEPPPAEEPQHAEPQHDEERPASHVAAAEEPEASFVTETMAELYIQQGHLDSALDIYRRLVDQRPDEPELRERLRAIEDRLFGAPAAPSTEAAHAPSFDGPTIREFLMGLVARQAANGGSSPASETLRESSPEASRRESRMTPGASETITGSIDALFSGAHAPVSDADLDAASALAAAFATTPEPEAHRPTPLPGTPAHRAPDELSLDHVFKANTPPRESSESNGFSFDQFFAEEMTDAPRESSGEPAPGSPESTDDIAQFNAWLNGLKKT